jgi:thiamine biosynthesis lipoprotein
VNEVFVVKTATICILFLVVLFLGRKDQKLYSIHGLAQGTDFNVNYFADSERVTRQQIDSVLVQIDSSMSLYKPYSLISKFNNSSRGIRIDPGFLSVVKKAFQISKESKGRFDITVGPLVQLWGFGPHPVRAFPDEAAVGEALKFVGMKYLRIDGDFLQKTKRQVQIDLNGIAQGYSVDVVAAFLESSGINSYIVEIGGEVVVKGPKPDGSGYKIGIAGPSAEGEAFRHIVQIKAGGMTTSGNYNKTLQYKKEGISHLINPKTGYPLISQMVSVTVLAKDAITADGYDNALMAMQISEAMKFLNARKDLAAYFIYRKADGQLADTLTSGFKKLLVN